MKKQRSLWPMLVLILAIGSSLLLFGCGGGSESGDGAASSVSSAEGVISGAAVKGPVSGATVKAYAINNGVMGRRSVPAPRTRREISTFPSAHIQDLSCCR